MEMIKHQDDVVELGNGYGFRKKDGMFVKIWGKSDEEFYRGGNMR